MSCKQGKLQEACRVICEATSANLVLGFRQLVPSTRWNIGSRDPYRVGEHTMLTSSEPCSSRGSELSYPGILKPGPDSCKKATGTTMYQLWACTTPSTGQTFRPRTIRAVVQKRPFTDREAKANRANPQPTDVGDGRDIRSKQPLRACLRRQLGLRCKGSSSVSQKH
ncbi:hypothetical protein K445DRAFT_25586 [Daldinia sp. EC12]|nr:hypothetical protein K445DRAFT_25586 [Daldinia sp. EC12]